MLFGESRLANNVNVPTARLFHVEFIIKARAPNDPGAGDFSERLSAVTGAHTFSYTPALGTLKGILRVWGASTGVGPRVVPVTPDAPIGRRGAEPDLHPTGAAAFGFKQT